MKIDAGILLLASTCGQKLTRLHFQEIKYKQYNVTVVACLLVHIVFCSVVLSWHP